jgi:hypothetical protein
MLPWILSLALAPQDAALARVKQTAYARIAAARSVAQDAQIVAFVAARNAQPESLEEVRRKDALWIAGATYPLRRTITQGDCAARLRALLADDPIVVESLLMDARGALVCASAETSDYWQGDEAKWQETFQQGKDPFIDEPALDTSTNQYAIQLSVPVSRDQKRIGALTLTLKLPLDSTGTIR